MVYILFIGVNSNILNRGVSIVSCHTFDNIIDTGIPLPKYSLPEWSFEHKKLLRGSLRHLYIAVFFVHNITPRLDNVYEQSG